MVDAQQRALVSHSLILPVSLLFSNGKHRELTPKLGQTCQRCDLTFPNSKTCNPTGAITCIVNSAGVQLYVTKNQACVLPSQCPAATWPQNFNNDRKCAEPSQLTRIVTRALAVDYKCTACDDGTSSCIGNGAGKALAWQASLVRSPNYHSG